MKDRAEEYNRHLRVEKIREKIDNQDYLDEAIQRIAQVLSNEIMGYREGASHEQQRERWKTPLL